MLSVCIYLQVHQPYRVRKYRVFDIGESSDYFSADDESNLNNKRVLQKVAGKAYRPANAILLELLHRHPEFRASFSFSGVVLEQMEQYDQETLNSFRELVETGRVEILSETYHHSLAFFYDRAEFERQVTQHRALIERLFGVTPKIFRNTELAYTNELAHWAERAGYNGILAEGWDHVLGWRSPTFLYQPKGTSRIKALLKHYRLSDDIAFRFSNRDWHGWPLSADTFANWVHAHHGDGNTVNLFMDYETFGEHQWEDTGIFEFLRHLPQAILAHPETGFKTPSEVLNAYTAIGEFDVPHILTWADTERDLSAWTGNDMQRSAIEDVYALGAAVLKSGDEDLIEDWRKLQTSDHFYYMCTKWSSDGDVHAYFNPYETPYDAYISYRNALEDVRLRAERAGTHSKPYMARLVGGLSD